MSLTFLLHFSSEVNSVLLLKKTVILLYKKKKKKHFAVKMATFLPRAKWWLANPLQKKTET